MGVRKGRPNTASKIRILYNDIAKEPYTRNAGTLFPVLLFSLAEISPAQNPKRGAG